ncbi:hypothetical protein BV898_02082 [Hypsibius exemplaris]|uniref:Tc1-like transposase DDE domain-containing protein n=1 Tax=Hypsibius exemplaris TaxID=2072580 RepID=A0A1W0XA38_HYPEX|nr:hypothetical protein BV898_02082 [Hypsibius exemplaris]
MKQPMRKMTPAMVRRMVRMLTIGKAHHSFRTVANALQLDESSVQSHLQDRNIKCFKKIKRNLIPETQKEARRKCVMNLRKTIPMSDVPNMLFLDECYICAGKYFNHQNERCYGYSLETISNGKKIKHFPKTALCAMVFGAVSSSGQSPLVVLKSGFSLNQHTYKDSCLKPMLEDLLYGLEANSAILYQNKAPCHTAGTVQAFLKEKMSCFIPNADISPNSPDFNPLD